LPVPVLKRFPPSSIVEAGLRSIFFSLFLSPNLFQSTNPFLRHCFYFLQILMYPCQLPTVLLVRAPYIYGLRPGEHFFINPPHFWSLTPTRCHPTYQTDYFSPYLLSSHFTSKAAPASTCFTSLLPAIRLSLNKPSSRRLDNLEFSHPDFPEPFEVFFSGFFRVRTLSLPSTRRLRLKTLNLVNFRTP